MTVLAVLPAAAQDLTNCGCVLPYQGAGTQVGSLVSSSGDVKITQGAGLLGSGEETGLKVGSRVLVGPGSSAALVAGAQCNLAIAENSTVNISRIGDSVCVSLSQSATSAANTVGFPGPDGQGFGFPEYFAGATVAAVIAGGVLSNGDDDEPASP